MMAEHSLRDNILNQLKYNCDDDDDDIESNYMNSKEDNEDTDCMKETAATRSIARPLTENLVKTMFQQYMDLVVADETNTADYVMRKLTCTSCYMGDKMGKEILNPIVESLSENNDSKRGQKVEFYIERIVELFKAPKAQFLTEMPKHLPRKINEKLTIVD